METNIALDSQTYTYLIDSWKSEGPETSDPLYKEKMALFWTYFYGPSTPWISRTVVAEYSDIKDPVRRTRHDEYQSMVSVVRPMDLRKLENDILEYRKFHKGANDCRIVAETEVSGIDILLCYDDDLIKNLSGRTGKMRILRPSEYWRELAIPKGASARLIFHPSNPLSQETWHIW